MNKIVLLFVLFFVVSSCFAQKFTIRGQVTDTLFNAMPSATAMLMSSKDSSLVNFSATDAKGFFEMKNVAKGNYQVKVTFVGFAPATKDLTLSDFNPAVVDVGKLTLSPVSAELEALVVQGEKAPVTVKRDTIEFNAGSFKTKANANVEDLLKKMPGMDVQSDGTIRAQGEQVQRVTVDGREFFGRDPKLATRNLPADAIDKVQVFDKKSDQAAFTGVDDGQREKTINLELKEEKRNGAFGTLMGGAGTNDRFQGKASVNRFSKGKQLSFLGMGNNVNEQGFSFDDYMNFSGGSQQMAGGGGSVQVQLDQNNQNGVPLNFGGRQNGIMTNYAGGLNFNQDLSNKTKAGGSYFYNRLDQNVVRTIDRINYLPDGNYRFSQTSKQLSLSDNHRVNFTLDQQIDSANSVKFMTNASYTVLQQNIQSLSRTLNTDSTLQNQGARNSITDGTTVVVNSSLLYRHRFPKKGRTLSTTLTFGLTQSNSDGSLQSTNQFYSAGNEKQDIRQTNSQRSDNHAYGAQFSYTEPLGNRKYLEFNYAIRTNLNQVDRQVYDVANGQSIFNNILSNQYNSTYLYNRPGINLRVNRPKYNFAVGVNYQNTRLNGNLVLRDTSINKTFENVLPVARFNYDFSSLKHLRIDYQTSMQEPTIQQLQPVVDNSDPLNLSAGNPNLRPGYAHSIRTNFTTFDPGSFIGFFAFVNANYTANAISWSQTVNQNLVRLTLPVNVKDNLVLTSNFSFGLPVKKLNGRFNVGPTASYVKAINLLNGEENTSRQRTVGGTIRYDYTLKEILTAGVSANLSHQKTEYSFSSQQDQAFLNSTYSAEANVNFLKSYSFNSTFDFYQYRSETTGFDRTIPILNMSVSRFIMKNKMGELKAAVVNLLDQSLSANQTATSNYLQQEVTNNLGRYFMLSFTYALNKQLNPMGAGQRGGGGMRMMIRN